ncbi:MAG TPA: CBS domain-containing protein [Thermoanaerobaculia bacterium]
MQALKVRDLMTAGVFAVLPDDPLRDLQRLTEGWRVRHAPVVDEAGTVVGVVSQRDLLARTWLGRRGATPEDQAADLDTLAVRDVMSPHVETVSPGDDAADAARRIFDSKLGCLVVTDERLRLRGILTEADFVRWFADQRRERARLPRWIARKGGVVPYEESVRP